MSVLAHVVRGGPQQNEPAATQALTYILNKSSNLVRSLIDLCSDENLQFEPGRVDAEQSFDDGQPDLTIYDSEGRLRVLVENKFWAGLTKAQPVFYLRKLSYEYATALIFIVPERRVPTVWNELEDRCIAAKLEWTDVSKESSVMRAFVDSKTLVVTSWTYVLNRLLDFATAEGLDEVRPDTLQLLGLTNSMNLGAFLPLKDGEANNQELPSRWINYIDLIPDIFSELEKARIIDKDHSAGATPYSRGRYMNIRATEKIPSWFGIHVESWRDEGISPLWCWFASSTGVGIAHFQKIPDLFKNVRSRNDGLYIPIRLKTDVERERVVENAVAQIKRIAIEVLSSIPD